MATRPYVDLPFGPLLPDYGGMPVADLGAYLTDCVNLRSTPNGYRGQPTFTSFGTAPGTTTTLGTAAVLTDGFVLIWLAITDSGVIYESHDSGVTWSANSPASGSANTDTTILVADGRMYLMGLISAIPNLLVKTLGGAVTNDFAASASGIGGRFIGRVREHLVLGAPWNGSSYDEYTIRWSAIGDPEDFPTPGTSDALAKEAGEQLMPTDFGRVRRIVGGEKFGIVAQEYGLSRMTYVGGSAVYEFDAIDNRTGSGLAYTGSNAGPVQFVDLGDSKWMWLNEQGAFLTDGYSIVRLSDGVLEEALFLDSINHDSGPLLRPGRSAYDQRRKQVIFTTRGGSGADQHLCFNTGTKQFSFTTGNAYHILFDGPGSLADATRFVYSFGTDRLLRKLNADAGVTIALQTGYLELDPGYKTQITGAHLLGTGVPGSLTLAHKSTSLLSAVDVSQSGFTTMTANPRGMKASDRTTDQFHAFRVTGTGAESQLIRGIRVYFERGEPAT